MPWSDSASSSHSRAPAISISRRANWSRSARMSLLFRRCWGCRTGQILIGTLLAWAVAGVLLERALIRPLMRAPAFTVVVATLAVGLMIKNVLRLSVAGEHRDAELRTPYDSLRALGDVRSTRSICGSSVVRSRSWRLLACSSGGTSLGKAMQAVSQNQDAARLMGVRVEPHLHADLRGQRCGIAALARRADGPVTGVQSEMGAVILKGFCRRDSRRLQQPPRLRGRRRWCSGCWRRSVARSSAARSRR